ncbi:hypothetical protein RCO28_09310 [Streptomyces sp. LHD-70]|uniref:hypothetical protein n=1 Tax=Streptomyces sp. LHD-70 TaxID=3072140 RepID=UPI00280E96FA|nr:hypothetical protein [Streptomyces sp. LHD-70]MDQ8702685.1 hypothetical protein [Streptomyces sp. LHD-70]
MGRATERTRAAVERARDQVPAGEAVRGAHVAAVATRAPKPGRFRRPRVLRGEWRTLFSWCLTPLNVYLVLSTLTLVPDPSGGRKRPGGKPFSGGWDSLAGQLARALHPRSRNGVDTVMQVTDRRLQLVYVSHAGSFRGTPRRVEAGWSMDVRHVNWIRDRSDDVGGCHEIGFSDGSWCSVQFQGQGWHKMSDAFPYRLSHLDPHPYGG